MTIQECYRQFGGDFAEVEKQLTTVSLVRKFITKFLDDGSFSELSLAMTEGQLQKAFRAAHTLKGVSANLSLTRLFSSSSKLTELLRAEAETLPANAGPAFEEVKRDYEQTVSAIRAYLDSECR